MYKITLVLAFALFGAFTATAQNQAMSYAEEATTVSESASSSFLVDGEKNVYFIDFQDITINLNAIVIKDENGKVVWEDKVFDLPVDTIYELNLSAFQKGRYQVELQSFSKVIQKSITLR
ncbi:MAG: DUF3244 domain-containing protein [Bacteroidota bacterium]